MKKTTKINDKNKQHKDTKTEDMLQKPLKNAIKTENLRIWIEQQPMASQQGNTMSLDNF